MKGRIGVLVAMMALAAPAFAHREAAGFAYARVVDVRPVIDYVRVDRPRRECWEEAVYEPGRARRPLHDAAPVIAGGVLGGAIAHELGHGRGAITLLGAVAGSALANEVAADSRRRVRGRDERAVLVSRCETIHVRVVEERIAGYDVTYRYLGRRYRTRTAYPPGQRIRVLTNGVAYRY